jgi:hypothetical protein
MIKSIEFRFLASIIGMYLLLLAALTGVAFRTEGALKFITSPRRTFSHRELLVMRSTAIFGIFCFSGLIVWLVWRYSKI